MGLFDECRKTQQKMTNGLARFTEALNKGSKSGYKILGKAKPVNSVKRTNELLAKAKKPKLDKDRKLAKRAAKDADTTVELGNEREDFLNEKRNEGNRPHKNTVKGQEYSIAEGMTDDGFTGPQQPSL
jgi:hypothetical protein